MGEFFILWFVGGMIFFSNDVANIFYFKIQRTRAVNLSVLLRLCRLSKKIVKKHFQKEEKGHKFIIYHLFDGLQ